MGLAPTACCVAVVCHCGFLCPSASLMLCASESRCCICPSCTANNFFFTFAVGPGANVCRLNLGGREVQRTKNSGRSAIDAQATCPGVGWRPNRD